MKMPVIAGFVFLSVISLVVGSVQHPDMTRCPGTGKTIFQFTDIVIKNAEVGQVMQISIHFKLSQTSGTNPALFPSISTPSGKTLECVHAVLPRRLKFCNGDTPMEKEMNAEWNNSCPVEAGRYTAHLLVNVPDSPSNRQCIGDGQLVATFAATNAGQLMDCVSFPFTVQLD